MEGDEDFDLLSMDAAFNQLAAAADDDLYVQLEEMLPSGGHVMFGDDGTRGADRLPYTRNNPAYQLPVTFTDGANDTGECT